MSVEIVEVTRIRNLRTFVTFPFQLYRSCPQWVPPLIKDEMHTLRKDKNPAFEFCRARYWLAYKDGDLVGRIAAIINNRYIEKWGNKYARFCRVDFTDDAEVSTALFSTAEEWAKSEGMGGINGPLGFSNLDKSGLLIEGFDEMGTMLTIYNHPYYQSHLERLGYTKDTDWVEYEIHAPEEIPEKLVRVGRLSLKRGGLKLVEAKRTKDFAPYFHEVFDVLNKAYSGLYGAVELTPKQIDAYVKQYVSFLDPRFNNIIVDKNNRVVAVGLVLPSFTEALQKSKGRLYPFGFVHFLKAMRRPKQLDLGLVAVLPEFQNRGLPAIMMTEVTRASIENGVTSAESAGELEDNAQVQAFWKHYDSRMHKRRRAYIKLFS